MTADTWTYFPPTWARTLAYSFSAPTATTASLDPAPGAAAGPDAHALATRATPAETAATRGLPHLSMAVMIIISIWSRQNEAVTCGCDHLAVRSPQGTTGAQRHCPEGTAARNSAAGDEGARHEAGGGARRGAGQPPRFLQCPADPRRAAAARRAHRAHHGVPAPPGAQRGRQR